MSNIAVQISSVIFFAVVVTACGKTDQSKTEDTPMPTVPERYKGWKDYKFADGTLVVKYPADKALLPEPKCYAGRISGCNFNTGQSGLRLSWGKIDRPSSEFTKVVIDGEKARGKLLELHDIKVNGFDGTEFVIAAEKDGEMRFRLVVVGDTFVLIFGFNLESKFAASKEEIDKFVESMSPTKPKPASP